MSVVCLGDNGRAVRLLFVQHPREQGEGFDAIIRPSLEGAGWTTPEQTGHYSHDNTKLANSRYFQGNSSHIALTDRADSLNVPPLFNLCVGLCLVPKWAAVDNSVWTPFGFQLRYSTHQTSLHGAMTPQWSNLRTLLSLTFLSINAIFPSMA